MADLWSFVCCFFAPYFFMRTRFWRARARTLEGQRNEMAAIAAAALAGDHLRVWQLLEGSEYARKVKPPGPPTRGDA